jgi:hypothetical protein
VERIDISVAEHAEAIAKITDLAKCPRSCLITKRAMEDVVKLRLTKDAVLDGVLEHLANEEPVYVLIQEQTGRAAYVLLPCAVEPHRLYVKVQVQTAERKRDELLIIISAHPPKYAPPREVKHEK